MGFDLVGHVATERAVSCGCQHLWGRAGGDEHGGGAESNTSGVDIALGKVRRDDRMVQANTVAEDRRGLLETVLQRLSILKPTSGNVAHAMENLAQLPAQLAVGLQQDDIQLDVKTLEGGAYTGRASSDDNHVVLLFALHFDRRRT